MPNALGVTLGPGRALPALVLGQVDEPGHPADHGLVEAGADELACGEVVLDVGLENRVEHLVGRQAVDVALVRRAARPTAPW